MSKLSPAGAPGASRASVKARERCGGLKAGADAPKSGRKRAIAAASNDGPWNGAQLAGATAMIEFGPAAFILIGFLTMLGGVVGVYGATGLAGPEIFHGRGR